VGALYGPLHGGANEAVLRMLARIGTVADVPRFLEGVKAKREKLFGFGHRVYKNFDPRAKIIRTVAEDVFQLAGRDPLIEIAIALQARGRCTALLCFGAGAALRCSGAGAGLRRTLCVSLSPCPILVPCLPQTPSH